MPADIQLYIVMSKRAGLGGRAHGRPGIPLFPTTLIACCAAMQSIRNDWREERGRRPRMPSAHLPRHGSVRRAPGERRGHGIGPVSSRARKKRVRWGRVASHPDRRCAQFVLHAHADGRVFRDSQKSSHSVEVLRSARVQLAGRTHEWLMFFAFIYLKYIENNRDAFALVKCLFQRAELREHDLTHKIRTVSIGQRRRFRMCSCPCRRPMNRDGARALAARP